MKQDLLLEIGLEELPARMVDLGRADLQAKAVGLLKEYRLSHGQLQVWGTPRRLAILILGINEKQADLVEESKGPAKKIAFDEMGNPSKAAIGFAKGQGVDVTDLEVRSLAQGEYVFALIKQAGANTQDILPEFCTKLINGLSFSKNMRWGQGEYRFPRPIRWLVALFGTQLIPFELAGVASGNKTRGHRLLHPQDVVISSPQEYVDILENAGVMVDTQLRKGLIQKQVQQAGIQAGGEALVDQDLLEEVTNLVEYPTAIWGEFSLDYLAMPRDVLITPMKEHQRYFPVVDKEGALLNRFITVVNGKNGLEEIKIGNEKVLAARLADAQFFWDMDRKNPLANFVPKLKDILFQEELGTVYAKVERIGALTDKLALALGLEENQKSTAQRAAYLAKADLVSNMVYEFPELQGIMGREYALLSNEADEVAQAIYEHYLPKFSGDELPCSLPGALVSMADKLDTIVGCFAVGLIPTGSQDPYALRRQALGIIHILLDKNLEVSLNDLLQLAAQGFHQNITSDVLAKIHEFFMGRFRGVLIDSGMRYDVIDAIFAVRVHNLSSVIARGKAISQALGTQDFLKLLVSSQRVGNLATKATSNKVNPQLFAEPQEHALYEKFLEIRGKVELAVAQEDYSEAINVLTELTAPIDAFFEGVMVMSEDEHVKENRLGLLKVLSELFIYVADFNFIVSK